MDYCVKSLSKQTGKEISLIYPSIKSKLHDNEHPTHMASFSFTIFVLTKLVTLYVPQTSNEAV